MSRKPRKYSEKIEIVDYNIKWPDFFKQESKAIQDKVGPYIKAIYHIGSTAIPGMPAKPVIDMILACDNLDDIKFISEKLVELNYHYPRRQMIPHHSFFSMRQDENMRYHLHIHERGSPQIKRHVDFRDYVIQHPEEAKKYAALKIKLAKKFVDDRLSYVRGKDQLVQEIDAKAKLWINKKSNYFSPNTGPMAIYWTQEKLNKAITANFNVFLTHFAQYLNQVELIRIPGYTIVNTGLFNNKFNYILDADFPESQANEKIAEITHYFIQKNTVFTWWISPYDQPEDLEKYLINNNYYNTENKKAVYLDLDIWNHNNSAISELEIIRAIDKNTLQDYACISDNLESASKNYYFWLADIITKDDPIEYYVGYYHGKPVVRIAICYFGQVAGLYCLSATKESYREAMQAFSLKLAKDLGYHVAVSLVSDEDCGLYQILGYKTCDVFTRWRHCEGACDRSNPEQQ